MSSAKEMRSIERYVVDRPIAGSFGAVAISVRNIGELGVQIEHSDPLRVATKSRLAFAGVGSQIVQLKGIVIWSRLSPTPNASGKYLYLSGVRVDDDRQLVAHTIEQLLARGILSRDDRSLSKKRDVELERERDRSRMKIQIQRPTVRADDPSPEQLLLIQHARERLRLHPDEAGKWYNRAKFALSAEESRAFDETGVGHKEDILAVWEYLERTIDLPAVARVFLAR